MIRKVQVGERFRPGASTWNAFVDAANAHEASLRDGGDGVGGSARPTLIFRAKNTTGVDLARFAVAQPGAPLFTPSVNLKGWQNEPVPTLVVPSATTAGRLAVAIEPIASGKIGRVMLAGVVNVKVEVTDADLLTAGEIEASTAKMQTRPDGSALILWREAGTSGERWAIVALNAARASSGGKAQYVIIASDQISTSPPRWRYTIKRGQTNHSNGEVTPVSGAPELIAYNTREDPSAYQNGQSLSIGVATLGVGPVEGVVGAYYSGVNSSGTPVYHFSEVNPTTTTCA